MSLDNDHFNVVFASNRCFTQRCQWRAFNDDPRQAVCPKKIDDRFDLDRELPGNALMDTNPGKESLMVFPDDCP